MSEQKELQASRKRISTKSILLILLVVAGSSAVAYGIAYGLNNALAAGHSQDRYNGFWGGHPGRFGGNYNASSAFIALSRVNDVTVTGFSITSSNQVSVTLSYGGSDAAPAVTLVAMGPNLSGSNTLPAGWGPTATTTVSMVGSGSLSTSWRVALLIVPYTGT